MTVDFNDEEDIIMLYGNNYISWLFAMREKAIYMREFKVAFLIQAELEWHGYEYYDNINESWYMQDDELTAISSKVKSYKIKKWNKFLFESRFEQPWTTISEAYFEALVDMWEILPMNTLVEMANEKDYLNKVHGIYLS